MDGNHGKVVDLMAVIKRLRDIKRANEEESWQQVKASNALSGIYLDAEDDERAGRYFSGEITFDEAIEEITQHYGVNAVEEPKLTLEKKLTMFDPSTHAGEAMVTGRVGVENGD